MYLKFCVFIKTNLSFLSLSLPLLQALHICKASLCNSTYNTNVQVRQVKLYRELYYSVNSTI